MKITGLSSFDKCCPIILGNTSNLFASKQAYADATTAVSRALLEPQSQQFIDTQDVGHTIFKGTTGNIRYGLPTIVDHEPIEPMLTPPGYDSHPFTAARGIDEIPGFREELDKLIDQFRSSQTRAKMYKRKKAVKLTENQINFLKTVSLNEYEPAKQIWDNLGNPSPSVRGKIIKQLVNRNYIESKIMRCRSPHQLVRLTEKGWEYVKGKSKYLATRGDLIHAHVCIWICMLGVLRRYEKSLCEMQVPGTSGYCDAGHLIDGRWHLYEVAIECFDNIPKHVKTAFIESDADIASLTIVTLTKSDHTKAEQIILADPEIAFCINKIQFLTAEELMKELWPQ
jgi:DNA-binding MarR family transcriptional regulator